MAVETLQVSGVSSPDSWTLGAGASKTIAVQQPDNDATSFISSGATNGTQQQFTVANSALPSFAVISNVAIKSRCLRGGSQNGNFVVTAIVGANTAAGTTQTSTNVWTTFTDNFATKPGGGAWTVSDVNSLEIRIQNSQARDVECSSLYIEVTYTATNAQTDSAPGAESLSLNASSTAADSAPSESLSGASAVAQTELAPNGESLLFIGNQTQSGTVSSEVLAGVGASNQTETTPGESFAYSASAEQSETLASEALSYSASATQTESVPNETLSNIAESRLTDSVSGESLLNTSSTEITEPAPNELFSNQAESALTEFALYSELLSNSASTELTQTAPADDLFAQSAVSETDQDAPMGEILDLSAYATYSEDAPVSIFTFNGVFGLEESAPPSPIFSYTQSDDESEAYLTLLNYPVTILTVGSARNTKLSVFSASNGVGVSANAVTRMDLADRLNTRISLTEFISE